MAEKCIDKYFDIPAGCYSGLLVKESTMKKLHKLMYKQIQEIIELLSSDLSQIEISDWTLAYPEGEQKVVKYFTKAADKEKLDRIKLFNGVIKPRYVDLVYYTDKKYNEASKDVEESFMRDYRDYLGE